MEVLGADGLFSAVVSGDDVVHGKPAPDLYVRDFIEFTADAFFEWCMKQ